MKQAQERRTRAGISTRSEPNESIKAGWIRQTKVKVPFSKADQKSVPVTLDQSEEVCILRLEGEVDIACAAEMKQLLLQALGSGKELRVDVERATELDVTALQLLWATDREARGSGRGFTLAGRVPGEISVAILDAGFGKFPVGVAPK